MLNKPDLPVWFIKAFVYLGLFSSFGSQSGFAQSIAASLSDYQPMLESVVPDITASSFSGVAYHPETNTLYVVDDSSGEIYVLGPAGDLIRTVTITGFSDTEGIAWQSGDYFYIVEERLANVRRILLPQNGSGPVDVNESSLLSLAEDWGNSGLKDVAFNAASHTAYAIKEMTPSALYRITLDTEGIPVDFLENDPFSLENITGDAAGIFALADGNFLIVNQEENKLSGYSSSGEILSEMALDMSKPEGVTVNELNGTIYVVGEPREFSVFESTLSPVRPPYRDQPVFTSSRPGIFGSMVVFEYTLYSPEKVFLEVFSPWGKRLTRLAGKGKTEGSHRITLKTGNLPSGILLYTFRAGRLRISGGFLSFIPALEQ
ncbi:SdiA-regulated domain-containing protein [Fibrobacterota bacterium]